MDTLSKLDVKSVKKAQVTGKLQKRDEERLAEVQKRKDEKESTSAANESADYFTKNFNKFKNELQLALQKSSDVPKHSIQENLDSMTISVQAMQKFLTDSTAFLPPREVEKSQEVIVQIQNDIQTKREELAPKKKFAFKGKKKTADVEKKVEEKQQEIKSKPSDLGIDMVDCNFANKSQEELFKSSDEINNKDIALARLENCTVKLSGSPSAIHINNLTKCKILCGPVSGSIFIDDCVDCSFVLACQQLRIHSTTKCHFYIHVTSKAIIEDCQEVEFAPYNMKYGQLDLHYKLSGLDCSVNNWDDVDDFNWLASDQSSPNWKILEKQDQVAEWTM